MQQHRGSPKLLTVYEVARYLDVSADTVYRLVHKGELPAYKLDNLIRIQGGDLANFLRSRRYTDVMKKRLVRRSLVPSLKAFASRRSRGD